MDEDLRARDMEPDGLQDRAATAFQRGTRVCAVKQRFTRSCHGRRTAGLQSHGMGQRPAPRQSLWRQDAILLFEGKMAALERAALGRGRDRGSQSLDQGCRQGNTQGGNRRPRFTAARRGPEIGASLASEARNGKLDRPRPVRGGHGDPSGRFRQGSVPPELYQRCRRSPDWRAATAEARRSPKQGMHGRL